jgi:hypothetical protein
MKLPEKPMSRKWVSALFKKLQARYGHKWTSAIDGIERTAVAEWSAGLAGITPEQITVGLAAWSADWPPSMDEFRNACRGMGDLSIEETMKIICEAGSSKFYGEQQSLEEKYKHPFILALVRSGLDVGGLRAMRSKDAIRVLSPVYKKIMRRIADGEIFTFPEEKMLENKKGKALTLEEKQAAKKNAKAGVAALRGVLHG